MPQRHWNVLPMVAALLAWPPPAFALELPGWCTADGPVTYAANYRPSFHDSFRIEVRIDPGGASADLRVIHRLPSNTETRVFEPLGMSSGSMTATVHVAGPHLATFLKVMDDVKPRKLMTHDRRVLDGIALEGFVCGGAVSPSGFESMSGLPADHSSFFLAFLDLAMNSVPDIDEQRMLENARLYLRDGTEIRDLGGSPRVLRPYGHLNSLTVLRAAFSAVPQGAPLIVDATNIYSIGKGVSPAFLEADRRKGKTIWVAAGWFADQLLSAGVRKEHIVDSLGEAHSSLEDP